MSDGRITDQLGFYVVAGVIGFAAMGLIKEIRKYPMEAESDAKRFRDNVGSSVVNPEDE